MEFWYFITLIGSPEIWMVLSGILVVLYFLIRKRTSIGKKDFIKKGLIIFIISIWLTLGITFALKYVTPKERPCIPCVNNQEGCNPYCLEDNAFPSGHSAVMFCVITSLFLMFRKKKFLLLFAVAILVAASRYFLGVHYPLDIFVGALIGIVVPVTVLKFYEKKF